MRATATATASIGTVKAAIELQSEYIALFFIGALLQFALNVGSMESSNEIMKLRGGVASLSVSGGRRR